MEKWQKITDGYTPIRGDIVKAKLFYDENIYIVEVLSDRKGKWLVYEGKSFHNEYMIEKNIVTEVLIDEDFYDRRIRIVQEKLDDCMNVIIRLRAEKMKRYG